MEKQKVIGIVGGGQLGRMLTLAALPLGFRVVVINPAANSPAAQAGAAEIIADLYDQAALKELAERADYITIEIEHLDADTLDMLAAQGARINPAPKTIRLIQDKFLQKEFLARAGVPVAPFVEITDEASSRTALQDFGGKMLLKTRHGAYDGRGNILVNNSADISKALALFAGRQLYAEAYVPFVKELAVMVARSTEGDIACYPVVETIHQRNICVEVLAPADITKKAQAEAEKIAVTVAGLLDGAGTFGVEMFLAKDGQILVNEIAPRVHNSGHYTMEANRTSQFEQHIRAVTGLPLGDTGMVVPAAVTVNILGERNGPTELTGLPDALKTPHLSVHLYGKSPTKIDRKMGHITVTGKTVAETRKQARAARKQLSI
jgi:5-(carboxyamino)imidazole ribonucleotide synthase